MIGSVSASRRANAFADSLNEHASEDAAADQSGDAPPTGPTGSDGTAGQATLRTLLSLANSLEALPRPAMAPDVKTVQRAQLIAAMESAVAEGHLGGDAQIPEQRTARGGFRRGSHRAVPLGPLGKLRPRSRLTKGLAASGLSVGVAAGAFTGAAAASTDALPGDTLYGLKLGMEDLRLDMADDEADRGRMHLKRAGTRLNEARRLMERDRAGALDQESLREVRSALSSMHTEASAGHRLLSRAYERDGEIGSIQSLSSFSATHRSVWFQLRDRLPDQLSDVEEWVSSVFEAMDEEVAPLKSLLLPGALDEETDDLPDGGKQTRQDGAPETSAPSDGTSGGPEGREDGTRSPSPSGSVRSEDEGLLGGTDVLEPPEDTDSQSSTPSGTPPPPEPDITIPPLFPDILPGLSVEGGSDAP